MRWHVGPAQSCQKLNSRKFTKSPVLFESSSNFWRMFPRSGSMNHTHKILYILEIAEKIQFEFNKNLNFSLFASVCTHDLAHSLQKFDFFLGAVTPQNYSEISQMTLLGYILILVKFDPILLSIFFKLALTNRWKMHSMTSILFECI